MNLFNYREKTIYLNIKNTSKIGLIAFCLLSSLILPSFTQAETRYVGYLNAKAYGYYANGEYDAAISSFKKAIKMYPAYAPLYDGIADAYVKQRQFKQASYNYGKASKLDPTNALYQIHIQEAIYSGYISELDESKTLLAKASALAPENPIILDNIKKIQNNNFISLELMTNVYQNSTDINLSKGNCCLYDKDYKNALNFYVLSIKDSLKKKKGNFQAYNNIGVLYLNCNKPKNALMYLKKALVSNSSPSYTYNNFAVLYYQTNNLGLALKCLNFAIKVQDTNPSAYNNKAVCNLKNIFKNINKPITKLAVIAQNNPNNVAGLNNLGRFYYLEGKYDLASSIYKQIVDLNTENINFIAKLADSYLANGDYSQAITYYKKFISIYNTNSDVFTNLARAYEKNNDSQNAFTQYQTALRIDSSNSDTYKYFGYFLLAQKREAEAKGIFKKYTELAPNNYDTVLIQNLIKKIG